LPAPAPAHSWSLHSNTPLSRCVDNRSPGSGARLSEFLAAHRDGPREGICPQSLKCWALVSSGRPDMGRPIVQTHVERLRAYRNRWLGSRSQLLQTFAVCCTYEQRIWASFACRVIGHQYAEYGSMR